VNICNSGFVHVPCLPSWIAALCNTSPYTVKNWLNPTARERLVACMFPMQISECRFRKLRNRSSPAILLMFQIQFQDVPCHYPSRDRYTYCLNPRSLCPFSGLFSFCSPVLAPSVAPMQCEMRPGPHLIASNRLCTIRLSALRTPASLNISRC